MKTSRGARYDAYHNGEIHYNGKPCKNCGNTLKFTSNYSCVLCESKRKKKLESKVYKSWINSERGRMNLAKLKKTNHKLIKKLNRLSDDQLVQLEEYLDNLLT